jgi:hypothetical protein
VIGNGFDELEMIAFLNELADGGLEVWRDPDRSTTRPFTTALGSLRGPLLCLLNNDIEIIDEGWLAIWRRTRCARTLAQCTRRGVRRRTCKVASTLPPP